MTDLEFLLNYEDKSWQLTKDQCQGLFNDELLPIESFDFDTVMGWMQHMDSESFELEYFEDDCEVCPPKARGKKKLVPYLEGHFYVFTKAGKPVVTSIDPGYEMGSFERMQLMGEVDQSYILSVIVCPSCGTFQLSLEQVDM